MTITEWLKEGFEKAFPGVELPEIKAVPATDPKFGDYQCNDALKIAKKAGFKNPREAALKVVENLSSEYKAEVAGPGFLNITITSEWLGAARSALDSDSNCGVEQLGSGKKVVIDYSSPNAAKQMHIGHIRSTVIGNAIDRIYRALGYDVIADNHLGDWGTQFGILIVGYRKCLTQEERDNLSVPILEKCYVESSSRAKNDEAWKTECREELVKLQQGDAEDVELWKRFIDISIAEFNRMYSKLGVKFDTYRGESFYRDMMAPVVQRLVDMGLAEESEGALVVRFEEEGLPLAIVRKSDGGFNYTTSDVACVESRIKDYDPAEIIYVTDDRQILHFKQFFIICAKMGMKAKLVHVPFGLMSYQGKAISTREGNLIKLDDLLSEATRRAFEIVKERGGDEKLAEEIGFGAVKYADLSHDPATAIDFNWDKALALEGNSGPYLQYAHARVCSLMDKAGNPDVAAFSYNIASPSEKLLSLQLLKFGDTVRKAAENYKPSLLADYLFQTAQLYSSFYQQNPILKSEPEVRDARLKLCALFGRVLAKGLDLLGMAAPSRI
ncbi:MAG: arginine--tRNA ligase [Kiritimatiellae bacterium]|nr:arginine--tRNA ligase [Kiritimatiellia bacterium]